MNAHAPEFVLSMELALQTPYVCQQVILRSRQVVSENDEFPRALHLSRLHRTG